MRHLICGLVAVTAVAIGAPASWGEERPILGLIGLIPDDPTTYRSLPLLSYVDFRAVEAAAGVPAPETEAIFAGLTDEERAPWQEALKRIVTGPRSVVHYAVRVGLHEKTSYDATGPDWFAIDRAVAVWQAPPHALTVVGGDEDVSDPQGFEFVLPQRGFSLENIDGVSVWSRFGDNAVAAALEDTAIEGDIFDEGLMTSLRLAVLPGRLVASRSWSDLRAVLGVAVGTSKPAAAADLLVPMIESLGAVAGGDGPIVQAVAFVVTDVGFAAGPDLLLEALATGGEIDFDALAAGLRTPPPGPPLPSYPLVLFADIAAGADQINVIALPYPERATAETAAGVVADRLRSWRPGALEQTVLEVIGGRVSAAVVDDPRVAPAIAEASRGLALSLASLAEKAPDGAAAEPTAEIVDVPAGGAVALVAIRYPLPAAGEGTLPAAFLSLALRAIYSRDFAPLAVP